MLIKGCYITRISPVFIEINPASRIPPVTRRINYIFLFVTAFIIYTDYSSSAFAFSTSTTAFFCIGIRQFLLLPNSTITVSSFISMTTP